MANEVVTGLEDLNKQLALLAPNIQKKLMRGALRAGLKVTLARARDGIHTVSGDLADSLRISTSARNGIVKATLKAGGKAAFYAYMVEFGNVAHIITAKNGKAISLNGHEYSQLDHPGAIARPFMRPALDAAATDNGEVFQAVGAYMKPKIDENLAKLPDETK